MNDADAVSVRRWSAVSLTAAAGVAALLAVLALGPYYLGAYLTDRFATLFIYVILATMWNALAGYAGLVSVGQQAFLGLGAYAAVRLSHAGLDVYLSLIAAPLLVGALSLPLSTLGLRLRGGQFAIGMWVFAELAHLLVNLDTLVQGETGTSLIALTTLPPAARRAFTYWLALGAMTALVALLFGLLRSRAGASIRAIRDDEEAANSIGVPVLPTKRLMFVLSATGCAAAGALLLATQISFAPKTFFGIQWTAYMIFMTLVGGLGTFEGPILGAIVFFVVETLFGGNGVWYLVGLGASALTFSLFVPRGLWGTVAGRLHIELLPVGYRLHFPRSSGSD